MQASDTVAIEVEVNGRAEDHTVAARTLLVHYLRETVGLTGTHIGYHNIVAAVVAGAASMQSGEPVAP
jgi:aerobic-type carbon monoxide dehydrogenase small subunit (CoxS/CutS family)